MIFFKKLSIGLLYLASILSSFYTFLKFFAWMKSFLGICVPIKWVKFFIYQNDCQSDRSYLEVFLTHVKLLPLNLKNILMKNDLCNFIILFFCYSAYVEPTKQILRRETYSQHYFYFKTCSSPLQQHKNSISHCAMRWEELRVSKYFVVGICILKMLILSLMDHYILGPIPLPLSNILGEKPEVPDWTSY